MSTATTTRFNPVDIICNPKFDGRITSEILDWLNTRTGKTWVKCENGQVFEEDETFECQRCEERNHNDNCHSVYVRNSSGPGPRRNREVEWCEGCRGEHAFHCANTSDYHSEEDYTAVRVDGDTWCLERNEDDLFYWESDSNYHTESEPEPEDSEEDSEDDVAGYHSLRRPWDHRTPPSPRPNVHRHTTENIRVNRVNRRAKKR